VHCMDSFQSRPDSRQVYFVAYNPFRDHWPDDQAGRSLDIVAKALREEGAYGVKVYPPSGYRPDYNEIPSSPCALFTDHPDRQWEARYLHPEGAPVTGPELDGRLDALFKYCVQYDIPIFTHSETGEFEARNGYGLDMADPLFWEPVLEKYPDLRLCFGHAGGASYWFDRGWRKDWGRRVFKLAVTYKNVFCEFGVHDEILDPELKERFITQLQSLIAADLGPYDFATKIMYGSDWYMPTSAASHIDFLRAYQEAFVDRRLIDHYRGFFSANALAFLNVEARLWDTVHPLPPGVADRLKKLVALR